MKCVLCSTSLPPCDLRAWIEGGCVYGLACGNCMYFRDNDTAKEFREHAKRIEKHQKSGKKVGKARLDCPEISVPDVTYDQRRRDRKKRNKKCAGISTNDMRLFLLKNPCHYCGECATNVDRLNVDDCYSLENGAVAACVSCNRRRRDKPRELFISHMKRVAKNVG